MRSRPFEELFELPLRNGLTKPKKLRGSGFKMVNMGELFDYPRLNNVPMDRVPLNGAEMESSLLESGDLLFARQSLVREGAGQCSIFLGDDEDVCFESHIIRCRINKQIANPLFYYYFFRSKQGKQAIDAIIEQGAGVAGIRGSDLAKLEVTYVEKDAQDRIAEVISELDDKIELNSQINQTLEQITQAIFKSWFVDFDPVKARIVAKQSGQDPERSAMCAISGKTETELGQLSDEQLDKLARTASLFPDELEESKLGLKPKGWEWKRLYQLVEINPIRTIEKGQVAPYLDMKNMPTRGHLAAEWWPREMGSGTKFRNGDTLLARITPCLENGKTAFVDFLQEGEIGWGSTEYIVMRSRSPLPLEYTYLLARNPTFRSFAIQNMTGTSGRQRVSGKSLEDYPLIFCDREEIYEVFSNIIGSSMRAAKNSGDQNRALSDLRDTLLPRFLAGEIEVSQT